MKKKDRGFRMLMISVGLIFLGVAVGVSLINPLSWIIGLPIGVLGFRFLKGGLREF